MDGPWKRGWGEEEGEEGGGCLRALLVDGLSQEE